MPIPVQYPLVPGHEAVGVCIRVGPRVTKFKPGDHVGIGPLVDSCFECHSCLKGEEQRCSKQVPTYNGCDWSGRAAMGGGMTRTAGGYSTAMVVHEHFCICIPPEYPLEHAGPILCAGTTMYDPLKRAGAQQGTRLGIVGLGGLGVMGVKLGKVLGCTVTVLSHSEGKRGLAFGAGADHFVLSTAPAQMAAHAGSLDLVINTVPTRHDSSLFTSLLTSDGQQIHTGAHAVAFAAGAIELLQPGQTKERTTYIGGVASTQEVMDLCARHDIRTEIDVRPVGELNRIFEWLDSANESGKRFVLDIAGSLDGQVVTAPATRLEANVPLLMVCREIAEVVTDRLASLAESQVDEQGSAINARQCPESGLCPPPRHSSRRWSLVQRELLQFDL